MKDKDNEVTSGKIKSNKNYEFSNIIRTQTNLKLNKSTSAFQ